MVTLYVYFFCVPQVIQCINAHSPPVSLNNFTFLDDRIKGRKPPLFHNTMNSMGDRIHVSIGKFPYCNQRILIIFFCSCIIMMMSGYMVSIQTAITVYNTPA
jgi:hypothetical protein